MSNPIYGSMQGQQANPFQMVFQKFQQFAQSFRGDAGQQIQQMMSAGKVNQSQYNQAVQMAQQFRRMFGGRV